MKDIIAQDLLRSGVALIELGVEDYRLSFSDKRRLSTSARNLFDGLITLLKAKIADDHPENDYAWLRWRKGVPPKSLKNTHQLPAIRDANTIGVTETIAYFAEGLDVPRINTLRKYRNKATHFSPDITAREAKEMLARFFLVVTDGLSKIGIRPSECFSDPTLSFVAQETRELQEEIRAAEEAWYEFDWSDYDVAELIFEHFQCTKCGSTLVRRTDNDDSSDAFVCRVCGERYTEDVLRETTGSKCECTVCGDSILPEELECYVESHMCGWHHHVYEKEIVRD